MRGRGALRAGRAGGVAFAGGEGDGVIGSGVDGGVVGGPERKVMDWEEKRRQNIEKMNEEMEKIAEYERSERDGLREKNPFRNFLDDPRRCGPIVEVDRKEGSRRHTRNWGGTDFERVKTGIDRERETHGRRPSPRSAGDMTLSMTGRERAEYLRWKTERERIDQERLERHKKPTGQWRREWDAEKNEAMFKEGSAPVPSHEEGGRRDENKRPPKPPTLGDFFAEGKATDSGRKKSRPRERGPAKDYSMHDNRWEEEKVVEAEVEAPAVEEKESDKVNPKEEKSVALPAKTEAPDADDEDEWEECSDEEEVLGEEEYELEEEEEELEEEEEELEEEEEEEEEEAVAVDPKREVTIQQPKAPLADSTKNEKTPAPKLSITIPAEMPAEKSVESKPLSPFSPEEGYCPVTDWGAQMDMELQTPQSSSEDSPPQPDSRTNHRAGSSASDSQTKGTMENLSSALEAAALESSDSRRGRSSHQQESRAITKEVRGVTKEPECTAPAPECTAPAPTAPVPECPAPSQTEEKAANAVECPPAPE